MKCILGLVGEIISEMAFDNAFRLDENERPWGGTELFMTVMTVTVLTQSALSRLSSGVSADSLNRARLRSTLTAVVLVMSVAQTIMRYPVNLSNMR